MGRLTIKGTAFDIGQALGHMGRPLARTIAAQVRQDTFCCRLRETELTALLEEVRERFQHLWEELRGISAGMEMDIAEVFLWNCLQNRLDAAASNSVVINRLGYRLLLNKRELGPVLAAKCGMIEVHPDGKPGFLSLYVPGCMPGANFAANRAGIAQVVDPVPENKAGTGLPGFIISRAVLDAESLADAIDIVMECDRFDSAHHILASTQEFVTVTIAATPDKRSVAPIPNRHWNTNHFPGQAGAGNAAGLGTSLSRYAALSRMMEMLPHHPTEDDMLSLLAAGFEQNVDVSVIEPARDDIGTALIKLSPGRIEIRQFTTTDPVGRRYVVTALPDKNRDADGAKCMPDEPHED